MAKDYYKTLEVSKDASEDEIKKAFRKKALKYHPDKEGGDEQKFKEINEAYQVLSDKQKRSQYDQFGQTFNGAGGQGGFGGGGFSGFSGFEDVFRGGFSGGSGGGSPFGDIFDDFFGGGRSSRSSRQSSREGAEDLILETSLTFEEATLGTEKEVSYTRQAKCGECKGNGAEPGSKIITCPTCGGSGEVRDNQRTILGMFTQVRTCSECNGQGKYPEKRCSECGGTGVQKKKEELSVKIPAGIESGGTIRLRSKGNENGEGMSGDLYIKVSVGDHKYFKRKGDNILFSQKIGISQAALGDTIEVPTLYGKVDLKIPAGIQSGDILKLRGKGVQSLNGGSKGDQLVKIRVMVPTKLSKKGKQLFEQLRDIEDTKKSGWFF